MNIEALGKSLIFVISLAMFCYQLNIATNNLMDPPTVDSSYERLITDVDIPLVTICPSDQTYERLLRLGYGTFDSFLLGLTYCNKTTMCYAWGAQLNLTFDVLTRYVYDLDIVNAIQITGGDYKDGSVFLPSYGLCKETSHVDVSQEIEFSYYDSHFTRIIMSNKNYRSFIMPDISSHSGNKIFMTPDKNLYYDVKIHVKSSCTKDVKPMTNIEYKKCVDDKLQNLFKEHNITCLPPWLSEYNQCNQTYPLDSYGVFKDKFYKKYIQTLLMVSNIKFEEDCKLSCEETTYTVTEKGVISNGYGVSFAAFSFNQKVLVTEKVPNYNMFQYIIDVGSSLGLWLGLSVFGLHDLVVSAVRFIKNKSIIRKIRSALHM